MAVRHRGPDDEGYLLWSPDGAPRPYAGRETSAPSRDAHALPDLPVMAAWQVALGHRRLSIVDLSPAGHQPMVHAATGVSVVYNGEVYNHRELRRELEALGHDFRSHCDTEVLLAAWVEWGPECLDRFNGMFAFVVLDPRDGTLHAARDRFGIKPIYWTRVGETLAFASEIKQLRSLPGFRSALDRQTLHDYFEAGRLDHTERTFDRNVVRLLGGERAVVRLGDPLLRVEVTRWYEPEIGEWRGGERDAVERFRELLEDSVRLRLRADVPVGSCLSGGLDSSSIVCLAREQLARQGSKTGQVTVTSCFEDRSVDEWRYAEQVVARTGATAVRVWPTAERLRHELATQLWFMDEPFDGTSQFSQWCVFAAAREAGLTVMLDGQGSDEYLGGYSGSTDVAHLEGLMRRGRVVTAVREARALARRQPSRWTEVGLAVRNLVPFAGRIRRNRSGRQRDWLRLSEPQGGNGRRPRNLRESLYHQAFTTSLPALLRYEDRNSMAWSIEARIPFLDPRLTEFVGSLPDGLKIRNGVKKHILRESMRGVLPEPVRTRSDKLGFATPELTWLRDGGGQWTRGAVEATLDSASGLFDKDRVRRIVKKTLAGEMPYSSIPWRVICFGVWISEVVEGSADGRVGVSSLVASIFL